MSNIWNRTVASETISCSNSWCLACVLLVFWCRSRSVFSVRMNTPQSKWILILHNIWQFAQFLNYITYLLLKYASVGNLFLQFNFEKKLYLQNYLHYLQNLFSFNYNFNVRNNLCSLRSNIIDNGFITLAIFVAFSHRHQNIINNATSSRFPSLMKSEPTISRTNVKKKKTENKLKDLQCDVCHKQFTTPSGLKLHSQHHTGKYSFFCDQCSKGFVGKSHYEIHMRAHEGRGYPCEYCAKRYSSRQKLQYHMSEHTGKYRFTCEICGKGFNEKNLFLKHGEDH